MNRLRIAKPEEVEKIKDASDLAPGAYVLALDTNQGTILGVVRPVVEVDPVHFPEGMQDKLKYLFIRDVETHLEAKGAPAYYFNVVAAPENEQYMKTVEHFGAEKVSKAPEIRFKKPLQG